MRQLYRNNPILHGTDRIVPGQTLVLRYRQEREGTLTVDGYAYPEIDRELLQSTLPFLSDLAPFTYGFTADGDLIPLEDQALIDEVSAEASAMYTDLVEESEQTYRDLLEENGVQITPIEDYTPWVEKVQPVYDKWNQQLDPELIETVRKMGWSES